VLKRFATVRTLVHQQDVATLLEPPRDTAHADHVNQVRSTRRRRSRIAKAASYDSISRDQNPDGP
jgi:hypothetical protein